MDFPFFVEFFFAFSKQVENEHFVKSANFIKINLNEIQVEK
jgi:hypothetical protein